MRAINFLQESCIHNRQKYGYDDVGTFVARHILVLNESNVFVNIIHSQFENFCAGYFTSSLSLCFIYNNNEAARITTTTLIESGCSVCDVLQLEYTLADLS